MELDTSWISNFELNDEAYKKFYKEKVLSVKLYILYVNRNSELFHIKKNNILTENTILKKTCTFPENRITPTLIISRILSIKSQ